MPDLWCRSCGQPLGFDQVPLALDGNHRFDNERLRWNVTMQCATCVAGRPISPQSGKQADRILYYLATYGIVRIKFHGIYSPSWLSYLEIHEVTGGHKESARQIAGAAVRGLQGLWVASHAQTEDYMLSHLKTESTPCMPYLCSVDRAESYVKNAAKKAEKDSKVSPPLPEEGLFSDRFKVPQVG